MIRENRTTLLMKERHNVGMIEKTHLMMIDKYSENQIFVIDKPEVLIGRSKEADISINDDSSKNERAWLSHFDAY